MVSKSCCLVVPWSPCGVVLWSGCPVVSPLVLSSCCLVSPCSLLLASQLSFQQTQRKHHLRHRPLERIIPAIPAIEDQSAHYQQIDRHRERHDNQPLPHLIHAIQF